MDQPPPIIFKIVSQKNTKLQRGASAIEMALLLPLLIIMIGGVIELSLLLHNQSVLVSATNMVARAGIANTVPKLSNDLLASKVLEYCQLHLVSVSASSVATAEIDQSIEAAFPQALKVTARYTYQGFLVKSFLTALQIDQPMTATTIMYNE